MKDHDTTSIPNPDDARPYTNDEIRALPAVIGKHEVARIARISERTVLRLATKGCLNGAFRVGSMWRFNADAICNQFGQIR